MPLQALTFEKDQFYYWMKEMWKKFDKVSNVFQAIIFLYLNCTNNFLAQSNWQVRASGLIHAYFRHVDNDWRLMQVSKGMLVH